MPSDESRLRLVIVAESDQWPDELAPRAARAVAGIVPDFVDLAGEISILLADDARMQALNQAFRDIDKPTNVLSFPAPRTSQDHIGDIALGYETLVREAHDEGKRLEDHLTHLLVHGVLHLAGYDHQDDAEAKEMEDLEIAVLAALGIPDPYRDPAAPMA